MSPMSVKPIAFSAALLLSLLASAPCASTKPSLPDPAAARSIEAAADAVAAAAPAIAAEARAQGGAPARVSGALTISVNEELGRPIQELTEILENRGFLAALGPGLFPGNPDDAEPAPGRTFVEVSGLSNQLMSVRVTSETREAASDALKLILQGLAKLEPTPAADAKQAAAAMADDLSRSRADVASTGLLLADFVERNGLMSSAEASDAVQVSLMERSHALEESRLELATQLGVRDALKEQLANEPPTVQVRRVTPNAKRHLLQQQIEIASRMAPPQGAEPSAAFLEKQLKWVEALEGQLASGDLADRVTVAQEPNPRREALETQLFETDRQVGSLKAQEASLARTCETLRVDAVRQWKLRREWDALRDAHDRAQEAMSRAEQAAAETAESARRYLRGTWMRVIAGPRVD